MAENVASPLSRNAGEQQPRDGNQDKQQRQRIRWIGAILASYALDTLFLSLFALAGTIPYSVPLAYGLPALVACVVSYLFFSAGWNRRFKESSISTFEMCFALVLQSLVVWMAPQIAFPYLANLFTVLSFGVLQLTLRQFALAWSIAIAGAGLTLFIHAGQVAIPTSTPFEVLLTFLFFASVLARCAYLNVVAQDLRQKLADSRLKLASALEQVKQLAIRDELTGAFNRRHMIGRLQEETARFERSSILFSVALFDLDHFKSINDTYGHGAGDAVLKTLSQLANETIRNTDIFGRYGGEEFLLILPATPLDQAVLAVERIRERMQSTQWGGIASGLKVTASIGVAESRRAESIEALLDAADSALYEAKRSGRDRVVRREAESIVAE